MFVVTNQLTNLLKYTVVCAKANVVKNGISELSHQKRGTFPLVIGSKYAGGYVNFEEMSVFLATLHINRTDVGAEEFLAKLESFCCRSDIALSVKIYCLSYYCKQ